MASRIRRIIIVGAAGRDFHNFNVAYRDDESVLVVAFTAAQIPDIEGRRYPPELAGSLYPEGIPIVAEEELADLIRRERVDTAMFAYSDVSHDHVMKIGSRVLAAGADYELLGPDRTMLSSSKPVMSVAAIRTGCGKSPVTRRVALLLKERGKTVAILRHPMPYGDLVRQAVQRFTSLEDIAAQDCTIEEREEYEHHVVAGMHVYAGVDYEEILRLAEAECDVVLWDGGNNDFPFVRSDLEIVVLDPHRAGHELGYYPGMVNFLRADVLVINKLDSAAPEDVAVLEENVRRERPEAMVVRAESALDVEDPELIRGKRILAVEDGPTVTHGGMKLGAAVVAAQRGGAAELVDPRPWLVGTLKETFEEYPDIGPLLPAMGYSDEQVSDLREVIRRAECDAVVVGTPIDLAKLIEIDKPNTRVRYTIEERGTPTLADVVDRFLEQTTSS